MVSTLKRVLPRRAKRWMDNTRVFHRLCKSGPVVRPRPRVINIELTTRCNLSCRMCSHHLLQPQDIGDMPFDRFRQTVDQAEAFPRIHFILTGLGEPLLYAELPEAIDYIRRRLPDATVGLITNAHFLHGNMAEAVLKCDRVLISLNANSSETYRWLHRSDRYAEVTENIESFLALRLLSRFYREHRKPFVSLGFLTTDRTECEETGFRGRWEPLLGDAGCVDVRSLLNWGGTVDTVALRGELARVSSRYPCIYLWHSLTVDISGNAYSCYEGLARRHQTALCLGSVDDRTLAELYSSDSLARTRRLHLEGRPWEIEDCRECNIYECYRNVWFRLPVPLAGRRWL